MKPTNYLLLLMCFTISISLWAQPPVCVSTQPDMTPTCVEACIICDIDGFEGRHQSNIVGQAPPGFCTFIVHNAQWIAFQAGSIDLSIQIEVSNCDFNNGLEMGIYQSDDCQNFNLVSNCRGGTNPVGNNQSAVFNNTEALTIGQYYYLVMDGNFGDNCDWKFTVLEGSTAVDPLDSSGQIMGDDSVCPNQLQTYTLEAPVGATQFEWTLNGNMIAADASVLSYEFTQEGSFQLCVTAKNACDEAPPSCRTITVESVPATVIEESICEGECLDVANTTLCEAGNYEFVLQNQEGCDSLVQVSLIELTTPMTHIDVNICDGDTLFVGNTAYTQSGSFQEVLSSSQMCDSIVNLELQTIVCNITSTAIVEHVDCYGNASGQIVFSIDAGTPPYTYQWQNLEGTLSGAANILDNEAWAQIDNLPADTYLINIADEFGNQNVMILEVEQPEALQLSFIASDYNGFGVSCAHSQDGFIEAVVSGGTANYGYQWPDNSTLASINALAAATYAVQITDAAACEIEGVYELTAPDSLQISAHFTDPNCDGLQTGMVQLATSSGGVAPYQYALNDQPYSQMTVYDSLSAGLYELSMQDANNCTQTVSASLTAPQIPIVELGQDHIVNLGDELHLQAIVNPIQISEIIWSPEESLSCSNCLDPTVLPLHSAFYYLTLVSVDDCAAQDSVYLQVNKNRAFYAPNVFSPNDDGVNDKFTIYGGQEVERIKKLTIFNRWGAVVFEQEDWPAGIESMGWNGRFKGELLEESVFLWQAEILFIDGFTATYSGDIMLVP